MLIYYVYQALQVQSDPGLAAVTLDRPLPHHAGVLTLAQLRFLERRVHYAR